MLWKWLYYLTTILILNCILQALESKIEPICRGMLWQWRPQFLFQTVFLSADHKLCLRYKKNLAFHAVLDKTMKTEIGSYVEASCLFVNTAVMTLTKWLAVLLIKLTIALLKHIVSVCVKNLSRALRAWFKINLTRFQQHIFVLISIVCAFKYSWLNTFHINK